jgi:glycosyltransferase involved in cell wall biosynthesis
MNAKPTVMVCHPGRQHSYQLAIALANAGMLAKYVTGVPTRRAATSRWLRPLMDSYLDKYAIDLDPALTGHIYVAPVTRRAVKLLASPSASVDWAHRADAWFDQLAARHVERLRPDIVVCYENAALETFHTAIQLGIRTILDAASFHHSWQDRFYEPAESAKVHERIIRRKDAELELAERIFTCSQLARDSYVQSGVASERVAAVPMGVELTRFQPSRVPRERGPVRFVFVGLIGKRKGADILRTAADSLVAKDVDFDLTLIGNFEPPVISRDFGRYKHLDWLSQDALAREMVRHDVLVLPSRHDSFGMVVAEAMACGLPVIVSESVGSKEMIVDGENGKIVAPGDAESLAAAMSWFSERIDMLAKISAAARGAAERYSWDEYRRRVIIEINGCHRANHGRISNKPEVASGTVGCDT